MTEPHPIVKQYHAVHRMLNGFTSYMKMKMHENMHKGTWEECTYEYLRNRITEELKEFDLAIAEGRYDDARLEAADVGNFFGMISDNIAYGRFKNYNCASNSSAKESSDKVLEELEKWALQEARTRTLKQHGLAFVEMQAKIEELRTKERER